MKRTAASAWAVVWLQEDRGEVTPESWGAARLAARLSDDRGVTGVILAADDQPRSSPPGCGLSSLIVVRHPSLAMYSRETCAAAIERVWTEAEADIFLTPATNDGREVTMTLALGRNLPCATNALSIDRNGDALVAHQALPAGIYMRSIPLAEGKGCVALAPETLERPPAHPPTEPISDSYLGLSFPAPAYQVPPVSAVAPQAVDGSSRRDVTPVVCVSDGVLEESLDLPPSAWSTEAVLPADPDTVDLSEAELVVTAGFGVGSAAETDALQELGRELGAALGVTRPIVDEEWAPFERQIGQTGRYLHARGYLGFGVSGAVHHTAAISDCDLVIAVNTDPAAPIFTVSDVGFLADVHEVIPALRSELARRRGGTPRTDEPADAPEGAQEAPPDPDEGVTP